MAITTLSNVKTYMRISVSTFDTNLTALVSQVDKLIKTYLGRNIEAQTGIVEYHDGDGTDEIHLNEWPSITITSVHDDVERNFNSDTLIASTDYFVDDPSGILILFNEESHFQSGKQNVKVVYNAGYATVPVDLVLAANKLVAHFFNKQGADGHIQETIGSYSTSYDKKTIPDDVREILNSYRRFQF